MLIYCLLICWYIAIHRLYRPLIHATCIYNYNLRLSHVHYIPQSDDLVCVLIMSELVPKPNVTSAVLNNFVFKNDDDGKPEATKIAMCHMCWKKVSPKASNTKLIWPLCMTYHPASRPQAADSDSQEAWDDGGQVKFGHRPAHTREIFVATRMYSRISNRWKKQTDAVTSCTAKDATSRKIHSDSCHHSIILQVISSLRI